MKKDSTTLLDVQEVIGLDLSDKESKYAIVSVETGEIVKEGSVQTARTHLVRAFTRPRARVVIEVGQHSHWVERTLVELGHQVIVANPRQVALIARSRRKNDRMDAITLARLGRFDPALLFPIKHRGKQAQLDLAFLRARDFLVANRTRLVNHVRSVAKCFGEVIPKCSTESLPRKAIAALSGELLDLLGPFLEEIAAATARIKELDARAEQLLRERYPEAQRLRQQIKGVGPITALVFVLTIEDPNRFARSRTVPAYLGLTPAQRQSGASDPEMHITRAGDPLLRRLLVQAAHYILGPFGQESDLRAWGLRIAGQDQTGKKGSKRAKKRAIVAVARKLAVLLHRLWVTGDTYQPLRQPKALEDVAA